MKMPDLRAWHSRTPEEARLFNPAFLGSLSYEFVEAYGSKQDSPASISLMVVALAITLHEASRRRLPRSTVTSLYDWLQKNENLLIGFSARTRGLLPYIQEAVMFTIAHNAIEIGEGHRLQLGSNRVHFPVKFLKETTAEIYDIVKKTKFVGLWFAKSGSEPSILAAWGVRP